MLKKETKTKRGMSNDLDAQQLGIMKGESNLRRVAYRRDLGLVTKGFDLYHNSGVGLSKNVKPLVLLLVN